MNCRQVQDHLFAGRDTTLPPDERAAFSTHLTGCAACRTVQHDLTESLARWRNETNSVRIPDAAMEWQKVRRRLHGEPAVRSRTSLIAWIAMPVAAAAAVALGLYVAPSHQTNSSATAPTSVAMTATPSASAAPAPSTVVYVDDKSGWTFVLAQDGGGNGQHI